MCQCAETTSPEGVCELSPSVRERLGLQNCVNCAGELPVCDTLPGADRASRFGDERGFCSHRCSNCTESGRFSESESIRQNKPCLEMFSTTVFLRNSYHQICSCLRKYSPLHILKISKKEFGSAPSRAFITSSYMVFILVSVLVEGLPVHKVRHHHFRPEDIPSCSQRSRREIHTMSLKESETAGLCPSWACVDIDERRRPIHITRVYCLKNDNSNCSKVEGDYHCTQLYTKMEVWHEDGKPRDVFGVAELWTMDNKTTMVVPTKIDVEHGCICASKIAKPAVNPINAVS